MRDLAVGHIPLAGLAKRHEELFLVDEAEPVVLPRTSQALYLVQRVRDEAHRFAITYHRKVREKAGMQSALDSVPGIGPKRKRALLRKFGSVKGIREATLDDVAATVGFTRRLAAVKRGAFRLLVLCSPPGAADGRGRGYLRCRKRSTGAVPAVGVPFCGRVLRAERDQHSLVIRVISTGSLHHQWETPVCRTRRRR
jgi:hypothetical protein